MKCQQLPPPEHLKEYIRSIWTLEVPADGQTPHVFRTFAEGAPGLVFQQAEDGKVYQNDKELPGLFLYGSATTHARLHATGKLKIVGIFLHPNALKTVFGLNAGLLTDTCIDASTLAVREYHSLPEQLVNTRSTIGQIELLSSWIKVKADKNHARRDNNMQYAASVIAGSKGNVVLKGLQIELQLSERSFERKFKEYIGMSPKLFSRICRFQSSLQQLRDNDYTKLSDIAFENEYADQSHFIRTFKEFAGFSPFQYQKQSPEVIENLATLLK
ncbi:helix-turn-helix transcriptional regulator [Paraflavitalea sp. CAU 1676]|uniref:helix-turn-helix transcriptional regulator n=1 Tax=Paraflavitalea sp. CAU 1676 TaxID=3032598 RepID=UPI0023DCE6D9|nr:helix-turn-helix transcriptional regulator [Paraflavitalea sp. CAU 1676]MDF2189118.1 helix-turn-helix transcriptional regulator [Paraflavitalea sp. CAU 1676]